MKIRIERAERDNREVFYEIYHLIRDALKEAGYRFMIFHYEDHVITFYRIRKVRG